MANKAHKITELRKLPVRDWQEDSKVYRSLMIIPSGKKHDSGYALMYIIGTDEKLEPVEIAAACDDINWQDLDGLPNWALRTDMYYPGGIVHFWSPSHNFRVGCSLSSTDVFIVHKPTKL